MIFPEGFSPREISSVRVNILPNHPSGGSINDILYRKYITVQVQDNLSTYLREYEISFFTQINNFPKVLCQMASSK